jgi:transcriptional regulator with XRE-family HTH domain
MTNGAQPNRQAKPMARLAAENLSAELARKGLSDREAANRLGLTNVYVSRRANGTVEMSVSDLDLFAGFLGIPMTRLLEDRDAKVPALVLPHLDSNQEPIGSQSALVTSIAGRTAKAPRKLAPATRPAVSIRVNG